MVTTCPACNAANDAQVKFCKSCGGELGGPPSLSKVEPLVTDQPIPPAPKSNPSPKPAEATISTFSPEVPPNIPVPSSKAGSFGLSGKSVAIGLILVAVAGGGAFFATKGGSGQSAPAIAAQASSAGYPVADTKPRGDAEKLTRDRAAAEAEKKALEEPKAKPESVSPLSGSGTETLIASMLDASARNADVEVKELKSQVDALPKPARGDRKVARGLNAEAMELLKDNRYTEAIEVLKRAYSADPADVEIVDNLGYAALKASNLDEAKRSSHSALSIAPGRSSAWASLGVILAQTSTETQAVAAFANAYRFSGNTAKTVEYLAKLSSEDPNPKVKGAAAKALETVSSMQQ